jgi:hypothetical protein
VVVDMHTVVVEQVVMERADKVEEGELELRV